MTSRVLTGLAGLLPAKARLKRALALLETNKYQEAFPLLAGLAQEGLAEAQYQVARAYLRGSGVPPNRSQGLQWLERAAEQDHIEAQYAMASLAVQGGLEANTGLFGASAMTADKPAGPDFAKAAFWAERASAKSPAAQALLGYILNSGPEEIRDPARAAELYRISAEAGSAQGHLGVAMGMLRGDQRDQWDAAKPHLEQAAAANLPLAHYLLGVGAERGAWGEADLERAAECFSRAAAGGARPGMARYGLALLQGRGIARDPVTGETWLRRAALAGDAEAATVVGDLYAKEGELPPNYSEAAIWFRVAADLGHAAAARTLGQYYLTGNGVGRDLEEAAAWFRKAAAAGDRDAVARLASLSLQGATGEADRVRTREWFETAARGGDPVAAYNFGVCLAEGSGIARDDREAMAWFRRAAETVPSAQYWLGRMLTEGRGTDRDEVEGRLWMSRAAASGLADAQVAVAEMLVNGRGGPRDHAAALAMFRRAADAGHVGGAFGVGAMLGGGHDVPEQREEAFEWFMRAATQRHPHAQLMVGRYLAYGAAGRTDRAAAINWLRRARAQGIFEAERDLERLAESGVGAGAEAAPQPTS